MSNSQYYVQGYADCIKDLETIISDNQDIEKNALLNLYITAIYLLKLNLSELQEKLNTEQSNQSTTDKVVDLLKKKGFTVIKYYK